MLSSIWGSIIFKQHLSHLSVTTGEAKVYLNNYDFSVSLKPENVVHDILSNLQNILSSFAAICLETLLWHGWLEVSYIKQFKPLLWVYYLAI